MRQRRRKKKGRVKRIDLPNGARRWARALVCGRHRPSAEALELVAGQSPLPRRRGFGISPESRSISRFGAGLEDHAGRPRLDGADDLGVRETARVQRTDRCGGGVRADHGDDPAFRGQIIGVVAQDFADALDFLPHW